MAQVFFMLAGGPMQVYRARNPKRPLLWQIANRHYDEFEAAYPEAYQLQAEERQNEECRGPDYACVRLILHSSFCIRPLRPYFQRHRYLLKRLCTLAREGLTEYLRTALDCPEGVSGIIMTLHTFGEYLESPTDMVIYRSRLNAKINRNFEVFTATDFLAAITQHMPDPARRWSATTAGTATRCGASATGAGRRT